MKSITKKIIVAMWAILGLSIPLVAYAQFNFNPQGGVGVNTAATGDMFYAASTNPIRLTKLTIGSNSTCLTSNGTIPVWGSCGSGGGFPFTPTTNFAVPVNATTGIVWFKNGLQASSTSKFVYASTTALTVSGQLMFPTRYTAANYSLQYTDGGLNTGGDGNDTFQIGYNMSPTLYSGKVASEPQIYLGFESNWRTTNYGGATTTETYFRNLIPNTSSYLEPYFNAVNRVSNVIEQSTIRGNLVTFMSGVSGTNLGFVEFATSTGITVTGDNNVTDATSVLNLWDTGGATYGSSLTHTVASPFRLLTIKALGGAGGWKGGMNFDLNYNAGAPFTAMTLKANSDGTTANVGIGTTTPNLLLDVNSSASTLAAVFKGNQTGAVAIGTVGNIGILQAYTNDSLTALGNMGLQVVGGSLGVGTTSPGDYIGTSGGGVVFDVSGQSTVNSNLKLHGGGASNGEFSIAKNGNGVFIDSAGAATVANDDFIFRTGRTTNSFGVTEAMRIQAATGNVGVGSTTPGTLFSVGNTTGLNFTTGTSSSFATGGFNINAGCFAIQGICIGTSIGTVTSVGLSSTGSITVGSTPVTTSGTITTNLNMANANSWTALQTFVSASSTSLSSTNPVFLSTSGGNSALGTTTSSWPLDVYATNGGSIALSAGPGVTQWVQKIDNSGNFTLSTTTIAGTATSTPAALTIQPAGTGLFVGTTTNAAATGLAINGTGYWTGLTASAGLQTGILCLSSKNEIINESVACVASSERFKQDIQSLSSKKSLEEVLRLNPVSFYFKPEYNGTLQSNPNYNGEQVGLIAEQVAKIDPRLTVVEKDGVTPHGVRYENLTALLIGAVQELKAENDMLKKRLEKLENK